MGLGFFQNVVTLDEARGDADTFTKNLRLRIVAKE